MSYLDDNGTDCVFRQLYVLHGSLLNITVLMYRMDPLKEERTMRSAQELCLSEFRKY